MQVRHAVTATVHHLLAADKVPCGFASPRPAGNNMVRVLNILHAFDQRGRVIRFTFHNVFLARYINALLNRVIHTLLNGQFGTGIRYTRF